MIINRHKQHILVDIIWVSVSVIVAVLLVKSGYIDALLSKAPNMFYLDAVVAGLFFTSVFTTAPAIVALGEISQHTSSLLITSLAGASGAVLGDMLIFAFMKNRFEQDIFYVLGSEGKKMRLVMKVKLFRWLTFFVGAIILASPIPDEVGLMMMGISKEKESIFLPTSFIFNFIGILLIGLVAKSL